MTEKHYDIGDTATADELGLTKHGRRQDFIARLAPSMSSIDHIKEAIEGGRYVCEGWERVGRTKDLWRRKY